MKTTRKVLVIQEDVVIREIMEQFLLSLEYSCISLSSLFEFDPRVHTGVFDVVITDILFEDIGRFDFGLQIREVVAFKHFIIVTNMKQEIIKNGIIGMPKVEGFFGMPLDLDNLKQQLLSLKN